MKDALVEIKIAEMSLRTSIKGVSQAVIRI